MQCRDLAAEHQLSESGLRQGNLLKKLQLHQCALQSEHVHRPKWLALVWAGMVSSVQLLTRSGHSQLWGSL